MVIVNEILLCEYVTECNVVPPCVRNQNKQAVDFGYVVIVKLNTGVQIQCHYMEALAECQIMPFGRSRRFGQAHRTSAERLAEFWPNVVC